MEELIKENKRKTKKELLITSSLVAGPLLMLLAVFVVLQVYEKPKEEVGETAQEIKHLDNLRLVAKAVYVRDVNTGNILYKKNENEKMPLASLTKLMTALVATELLDDNSVIRIDYEHLKTEGDNNLFLGEHLSFKDLRDFTLVGSSNDGAEAIASVAGAFLNRQKNTVINNEDLFILQMNQLAGELGLDNTEFESPTGLDNDEAGEPSALGTAKDITRLVEHILKSEPELLTVTKKPEYYLRSSEGFEHRIINTNEIIGALPNIIGSKTGYTDIAGGNLVVVISPDINRPIIITVLGSTKEGRFEDVKQITDAILGDFASL